MFANGVTREKPLVQAGKSGSAKVTGPESLALRAAQDLSKCYKNRGAFCHEK